MLFMLHNLEYFYLGSAIAAESGRIVVVFLVLVLALRFCFDIEF